VLQRVTDGVGLAWAGLAAQLPRELRALREPGGTERMALGDQAARGVDDPTTALVDSRLSIKEPASLSPHKPSASWEISSSEAVCTDARRPRAALGGG
jgi:hypothetical protein